MRWLLLLFVIGCATGQAVGTGGGVTPINIQDPLCASENAACQPWIESIQLDYVLTGAQIQGFDNSDIVSTSLNYNTTTIRSNEGIFSSVDDNLVPLTGENETNITLCVQPNWIGEDDITVDFTHPDGAMAPNSITAALTAVNEVQAKQQIAVRIRDTGDTEICDDGFDNDEDGAIDCADQDCKDDEHCVGRGSSTVGTSTGGSSPGSTGVVNVDLGIDIVDTVDTVYGDIDTDDSSTTLTYTEPVTQYTDDCNYFWFVHDHEWGSGLYTVEVQNPIDPNVHYILDFNVTVPENHCFDSTDNDADSLTDCHDTVCANECSDAYSDMSVDINLTLVNQTSTNFTVEVGVNASVDFDYVNVSTEVVENSTGILSNEFYGCLGINTVNIVDYEMWCRADSVVSGGVYTPLYNMTYNFTDTQHNITVNQSNVSVHGYDLTVNVEEMVVVQESSCNINVYGDVTGDGDVSALDQNILPYITSAGSDDGCGGVGESTCDHVGGTLYVCDSGVNSVMDSSLGAGNLCVEEMCVYGDVTGDDDVSALDQNILPYITSAGSDNGCGGVGESTCDHVGGTLYVCDSGVNSVMDSSLGAGDSCE